MYDSRYQSYRILRIKLYRYEIAIIIHIETTALGVLLLWILSFTSEFYENSLKIRVFYNTNENLEWIKTYLVPT